MKTLTIGQLSKFTDNTVVTIRYYEKRGILPKPQRSAAGYRLYPENFISRLYFIKNAKQVGFDLTEIKTLLGFHEKKVLSKKVKRVTQEKLHIIDKKIKTLQRIKRALSKWEQACDGEVSIDECPIMENLYQLPTKLQKELYDE